jgi:hypothetical protein
MTRAVVRREARVKTALVLSSVALAGALVACSGQKKHRVDRQDFQSVTDYVDKNMRTPSVGPDDRREYTIRQLGAPHHKDGDVEYWYTPEADCYYLQLGSDGWASWGPGTTSDCKRYAVTK